MRSPPRRHPSNRYAPLFSSPLSISSTSEEDQTEEEHNKDIQILTEIIEEEDKSSITVTSPMEEQDPQTNEENQKEIISWKIIDKEENQTIDVTDALGIQALDRIFTQLEASKTSKDKATAGVNQSSISKTKPTITQDDMWHLFRETIQDLRTMADKLEQRIMDYWTQQEDRMEPLNTVTREPSPIFNNSSSEISVKLPSLKIQEHEKQETSSSIWSIEYPEERIDPWKTSSHPIQITSSLRSRIEQANKKKFTPRRENPRCTPAYIYTTDEYRDEEIPPMAHWFDYREQEKCPDEHHSKSSGKQTEYILFLRKREDHFTYLRPGCTKCVQRRNLEGASLIGYLPQDVFTMYEPCGTPTGDEKEGEILISREQYRIRQGPLSKQLAATAFMDPSLRSDPSQQLVIELAVRQTKENKQSISTVQKRINAAIEKIEIEHDLAVQQVLKRKRSDEEKQKNPQKRRNYESDDQQKTNQDKGKRRLQEDIPQSTESTKPKRSYNLGLTRSTDIQDWRRRIGSSSQYQALPQTGPPMTTTTTIQRPQVQDIRTCYHCNTMGHIAKDCPQILQQ